MGFLRLRRRRRRRVVVEHAIEIAITSSTSRTLPRRLYLTGAAARQYPNVSAASSSPPATSVVLLCPDQYQKVRNSEGFTSVSPTLVGDRRSAVAGRSRADAVAVVVRRRGRQITSHLTPSRLRVSRVGAASAPRARACHLTRSPEPEARWTWSTVGRVPDVWVPHVRISFNYFFR